MKVTVIPIVIGVLGTITSPEQVLAAAPHKTPTVRPPVPYHENYSS